MVGHDKLRRYAGLAEVLDVLVERPVARYLPFLFQYAAVYVVPRVGILHAVNQRLVVGVTAEAGLEVNNRRELFVPYGGAEGAFHLGGCIAYHRDVARVPFVRERAVPFNENLFAVFGVDAQGRHGIYGIDRLAFVVAQ